MSKAAKATIATIALASFAIAFIYLFMWASYRDGFGKGVRNQKCKAKCLESGHSEYSVDNGECLCFTSKKNKRK